MASPVDSPGFGYCIGGCHGHCHSPGPGGGHTDDLLWSRGKM